MNTFNLHNKVFIPILNSKHGTVTEQTIFRYQQKGSLITATYAGDTILEGHIIGQFIDEETLDIRYHCLTQSGELKTGKAIARISIAENQKLQLDLNWQWLEEKDARGTSRYQEIDA